MDPSYVPNIDSDYSLNLDFSPYKKLMLIMGFLVQWVLRRRFSKTHTLVCCGRYVPPISSRAIWSVLEFVACIIIIATKTFSHWDEWEINKPWLQLLMSIIIKYSVSSRHPYSVVGYMRYPMGLVIITRESVAPEF